MDSKSYWDWWKWSCRHCSKGGTHAAIQPVPQSRGMALQDGPITQNIVARDPKYKSLMRTQIKSSPLSLHCDSSVGRPRNEGWNWPYPLYWRTCLMLGKRTTVIAVPYTDFKTQIKPYVRSKWQQRWDQCIYNRLHCIQPNLGNWKFCRRADRREETVLSRIRIGYTYFTHS